LCPSIRANANTLTRQPRRTPRRRTHPAEEIVTIPDDAYADLRDVPSTGDDYQPGQLTLEQLNKTGDDSQDRPTGG
jgi:hypothetical protein